MELAVGGERVGADITGKADPVVDDRLNIDKLEGYQDNLPFFREVVVVLGAKEGAESPPTLLGDRIVDA